MIYSNLLIKILQLLIGYIAVSFLAKLIILIPLVSAIEGGMDGLYLAITITIATAGLFIGAVCSKTIKDLPLYGALAVAALSTTYKFFRPDFSPLPQPWFTIILLVTFLSIMVGAYAARPKA